MAPRSDCKAKGPNSTAGVSAYNRLSGRKASLHATTSLVVSSGHGIDVVGFGVCHELENKLGNGDITLGCVNWKPAAVSAEVDTRDVRTLVCFALPYLPGKITSVREPSCL